MGIRSVKMTAKLWLTNVKRSLSGWMRTKKHPKRTLMASRRKSKEYVLLSLQSCTKLEELLVVCLVECQEECLVACLVMLAMLKVVQGQQLKKSIKRDSSFQPILISFWMSPYDGGGIDGS